MNTPMWPHLAEWKNGVLIAEYQKKILSSIYAKLWPKLQLSGTNCLSSKRQSPTVKKAFITIKSEKLNISDKWRALWTTKEKREKNCEDYFHHFSRVRNPQICPFVILSFKNCTFLGFLSYLAKLKMISKVSNFWNIIYGQRII